MSLGNIAVRRAGWWLATAVMTLGPLAVLAGANSLWTQWRGPERTGISAGAAWPDKLEGLTQTWRVELDKGYPGPIVAEDRVFVAETANKDTELVRALDRKTGQELWRASWPGRISVPFFAKRNGDWIRSTPAYDGKLLFVGGIEEVLVALDGKTGKEVWRVDFPARFSTPKPDFGYASSPLIDGDFLYTQAANSVVKLKRSTGETVWRALEGASNIGDIMERGAFSSPFIARVAGKRQLLVGTRLHMAGVDLDTGKTLWMQPVPNFRGMNILTPTVWGDHVFTSTHQNDTYLYKIEQKDGVFTSREVWRNKAKGYMSSPVIIGDFAYLHLGNQRFTCIDLRTGESKWTTTPYGQYWSMALRGDKILALDERGQLLLIRPNPEQFELLDSRELTKSPAWAHLAVVGNEVFVRELTAITAYRWDAKPAPKPTDQ
jgi:outer membrane protein assembly factor BamB